MDEQRFLKMYRAIVDELEENDALSENAAVTMAQVMWEQSLELKAKNVDDLNEWLKELGLNQDVAYALYDYHWFED